MQNKSKQNFKTCNNLSERTTAASEEEADAKPRDDGLSLWQALVYISTYDQLQLNQASISELPEGSLIQHHSAMRTVSNFNINVFWSSFTSWSLLSFYSQKGWRMMQSSNENTETTVLLGAGGILCLKLARPMTGTSLAVDEVPHIKCETYQDNVDPNAVNSVNSRLQELTTKEYPLSSGLP